MRQLVKDFIQIASQTLSIGEPIYEFGSLQVPGQEGFADLRPLFPGKEYVGCDLIEGPGVDCILDIRKSNLPSESIGTAIVVDTLEHVEYAREAIEEMHRILKPEGIVILSSVMNFPIHDYPSDYWRFTPSGFKSILKPFSTIYVDSVGDNEFPHTIVGVGIKGNDLDNLNTFKNGIDEWRTRYNMIPSRNWKNIVIRMLPPVALDAYRSVRSLVKNNTRKKLI
jgi:hypothetical protein